MAKNKNRKQAGRQQLPHRLSGVAGGASHARSGQRGSASTASAGAGQAKSAVAEADSDAPGSASGGPAGAGRGKQRRFGHN